MAVVCMLGAGCGPRPPEDGAFSYRDAADFTPGAGDESSIGEMAPASPGATAAANPPPTAPPAAQPPGGAPATLTGEFVCLSSLVGVVRMPGPFEIKPLPIPPYEYPDLRFEFKDATTWIDITFPGRPLEGRYEYDPGEAFLHLFSQPGPSLYRFNWATDNAGEEYLIQIEDDDAVSRYVCHKVGAP